MLSASVYGAVADKAAYTRQAAFSALQNEQMILSYARQHGQIKRADVVDLCHLSEDQASRLLNKLYKNKKLEKHGQMRWTFYTVPEQ